MKIFLVVNPGSRNGRGRLIARRAGEVLRRAGADFTSAETDNLEAAASLTGQALERGFDPVVAVGGDGTINRVIQGFLTTRTRPNQARLGVIYAGTSPDFCRFHGLEVATEKAVAILLAGKGGPIDICKIELPDRSAHFACSANFGLGAGIARRANARRRFLGDFFGTLLATVTTLVKCRRPSFRLLVDGRETILAGTLNITVGKNPHLASGLKLETGVTATDGSLFFFAIHGVGKLPFLLALPKAYSGKISRDPRFLLGRAEKIRIEAIGESVEAEFDGDPAGWCPAEITILPGALDLIGARA